MWRGSKIEHAPHNHGPGGEPLLTHVPDTCPSELTDAWKGVVISESLKEPCLIDRFEVFRARISKIDLDLGGGERGRWHLYYVRATDSQINALLRQVKPGWYCHFWRDDDLVVVFHRRKFSMSTTDKATWKEAVAYGRSVGIPEKELDFDLSLPA